MDIHQILKDLYQQLSAVDDAETPTPDLFEGFVSPCLIFTRDRSRHSSPTKRV